MKSQHQAFLDFIRTVLRCDPSREASLAELEEAVPKNTARAVYDFFHQKGEEPSCE